MPDEEETAKTVKAPCSLGEASLFSATYRRSATVVAVRPSAAILVSRQLVQDCIRLYPANKEYYSVFCELMATKTAFDLTDTLYNSASMRIHGCFFNPGGVRRHPIFWRVLS